LPDRQLTHELLIAVLCVLKVKHWPIYRSASRGNISARQFFDETRLDKIKNDRTQRVSSDWIKDMLDYCLMSDVEYAEATKSTGGSNEERKRLGNMGQWLIDYDMPREKVIPFFCSRLDRFALQP
jgi:hypothetical protein